MAIQREYLTGLDSEGCAFYQEAMLALSGAGVPFLVGGAYAFGRYTGIQRHTKDFDVFVIPADRERALAALERIGCRGERTFPHWLAKAFRDDYFVDVIYSGGNGLATVDRAWFDHAVADEVLGIPARLVPAEEMIWSKAFVMERERFDGADIMHVLHHRADQLDWPRLLGRFGAQWRVLYSYLVLFGFVYPCQRERVPAAVMRELAGRLAAELDAPAPPGTPCNGPVISRAQYLIDVEQWGYGDGRLRPAGAMTAEDVALWTEAIDTIP
ncbi:MAG TPA: hypothetical protein VGE07_22125 [Herpetosiphonaceae bacterium]